MGATGGRRALIGLWFAGGVGAACLTLAASGAAWARQPGADPSKPTVPPAEWPTSTGQPAVPPGPAAPLLTQPVPPQPASTQPLAPPIPDAWSQSVEVDPNYNVTVAEFVANSIGRVALIDLRQQVVDLPRDYRIVYRLMQEAERLMPKDLEVAHRLGEAAWKMDDDEAVVATSKRILELDPKDSVTLLRLVTTRLNQTQTLDQRLAGYERFLGPEGKGIDPAARSRLAMDAAQLLREQGNEKGFVEKIKMAAQLDPTNKEAAQEAALYFSIRVPDALGRMELISNLMYADPMDPTTQLWMAREMALQGVFDQADRFHTLGRSLIARSGQQPDAKIFIESLVLIWQSQGAQEPVQMLTDYLSMNRMAVERKVKDAEAALQSTAEMQRAKDFRLDVDLERVRILAAWVYGDQAALGERCGFENARKNGWAQGENLLDSAVADFGSSVTALYDMLHDPAEMAKHTGVPEVEMRLEVRRLMLEAQMLRAMTNVRMDQVEFDQDKIAELESSMTEGGTAMPEDAEAVTTRGWLELRKSGPEKALEILLPQADGVAAARFGVAMCREMMGEKDKAITEYRLLAGSDPMGVLGAAARSRMMKLGDNGDNLTPLTRRAREFGRTIPPALDAMVMNPSSFMSLSASFDDQTAPALKPVRVKLSLKNISSVPLSVGTGSVIDARFLLAPNMMIRNESGQRFAHPEVIGLERRLRLLPGEALEASVSADAGETGWMEEAATSEIVRLRWRVLQGFQTGAAGVFEPGIGCLSTMTPTLARTPLSESLLPVDQLTARVATDPDDNVPALATATRSRLVGVGREGPVVGEPREALARAWAERYKKSGPVARMAILTALPHAGISPEMEVLDDAARQETDPRVGVIVVATVCRAADDPFLKAAQASADPGLKDIATLQAVRLAEVEMTYSRNGPGLRGHLGGASEPKSVTP